MSLLKNTFGVSIEFKPRISPINFVDKMAGSSLERKDKDKNREIQEDAIETLLKKPLKIENEDLLYQERTMSQRTKSKIRRKIIAFSRIEKKLSFVTLTFLNKVTDRQAMKCLGALLDNVSKRSKDFQYIWVVEKQTKNEVFADNIHFHLITNKFWNINRWWEYWIDVQKKHGVLPREENFKPTSAFDVKSINSANIKRIGNYVSKYVTKNNGGFNGMLWNCSKKISQLYTSFYSDMGFLDQLKRTCGEGTSEKGIKSFTNEHCNVHLVPLNNRTTNFYNKIDERNREVWRIANPINQKVNDTK